MPFGLVLASVGGRTVLARRLNIGVLFIEPGGLVQGRYHKSKPIRELCITLARSGRRLIPLPVFKWSGVIELLILFRIFISHLGFIPYCVFGG